MASSRAEEVAKGIGKACGAATTVLWQAGRDAVKHISPVTPHKATAVCALGGGQILKTALTNHATHCVSCTATGNTIAAVKAATMAGASKATAGAVGLKAAAVTGGVKGAVGTVGLKSMAVLGGGKALVAGGGLTALKTAAIVAAHGHPVVLGLTLTVALIGIANKVLKS